jgi:hypothetical protein
MPFPKGNKNILYDFPALILVSNTFSAIGKHFLSVGIVDGFKGALVTLYKGNDYIGVSVVVPSVTFIRMCLLFANVKIHRKNIIAHTCVDKFFTISTAF